MVSLTYLGHSSFLIKNNELSFVIDPYQDNSVPHLKFPKVEVNFVFKSHDHHDHNAVDLVKIKPIEKLLDYETIIVPHDKEEGAKRGLNKIHIFHIDNLKIVHLGDIGCIPNQIVLEQLKDIDVLLAPINGFFTISSEELLEICKVIKPRLVVPMHYYKKDDNSGYPDDDQIGIFKANISNYLEVNTPTVELYENLFKYNYLIFDKCLQGGR